MKIRDYLTESGPKGYWHSLIQMHGQLEDMEQQVESLGSELNIAVGQGLYGRNTNKLVIMMKNLVDDIESVRMKVQEASKEAKKLK